MNDKDKEEIRQVLLECLEELAASIQQGVLRLCERLDALEEKIDTRLIRLSQRLDDLTGTVPSVGAELRELEPPGQPTGQRGAEV